MKGSVALILSSWGRATDKQFDGYIFEIKFLNLFLNCFPLLVYLLLSLKENTLFLEFGIF